MTFNRSCSSTTFDAFTIVPAGKKHALSVRVLAPSIEVRPGICTVPDVPELFTANSEVAWPVAVVLLEENAVQLVEK